MEVLYEGKTHEFPDDFTPEDVSSALDSVPVPGSWWNTMAAIPGTAVAGLQKFVGGTLQAIPEQAASIGGLPARVLEEMAGEPVSPTQQALSKAAQETPMFKAGVGIAESADILEKETRPANLSFWKRAVLSGVSSVTQQLPSLAYGLAARSPAMPIASAAAVQAGQTYAESAGATPEQKLVHASIDAAAEAVFEYLPMKFLMDHAGGPVLKTIIGTLMREVPTEVGTAMVQRANARLRDMELKDQPWSWEDYAQDLLDTAGATIVSAPLLGGAAAAISRVPGMPRAQAGPGAPIPPRAPAPPTPAAAPGANVVDNAPLSPPFDQPTFAPVAPASDEAKAMIASIDADLATPEEVEKAKVTVAAYEEARKSPPTSEAVSSWAPLSTVPQSQLIDAGELGASDKQAANAPNYVNPNVGPRMERQIVYGPPGSEGLAPQQTPMVAGTYTIGQPSDDRPATYLRALHDTVEGWRQEFLPKATLVLSNEQLPTNSALGWHYSDGQGFHIIVPAVLRNPTRGLGAFNVNTQASAFYNATHEFGHALITDRFFEGMAPELVGQVRAESQVGALSPATIAAMPEAQRAVLEEYNQVKKKILGNTMSAQEFIDQWFSPGKLGRTTFLEKLGVAPTDNAMALVKALVRRAASNATTADKAQLQQELMRDFLSVDEYLAEQTARHAYQRKWDQTSPLGRFFKDALESLRKFFVGLKKEGTIAPGTAFGEWMDGLSRGDRAINEGARVSQAKVKGASQPAKTEVILPKKKVKPKKLVETVQHNVETDTTAAKATQARQLVTNLVRSGVITVKDPEFKEMLKLIKQQDWDEFIDLFQRHAGKTVKFQLDEPTPTEKVGVKTDLASLVELFGLNMYSGQVPDVVMKELVQNSFDAVKASLLKGKITEGVITVEVDSNSRQLTVSDNGIGMDRDTLMKALLTYPGTSKPDLPIEHRSGGLGQAKQLLLFTPAKITAYTTTGNGRALFLTGTPKTLLDGTATLEEMSTAEPAGTKVVVTLPERVTRAGKSEEVKLARYVDNYSVLRNPPLFPNVRIVYKYGPESWQTELIPSILKDHQKMFTKQYNFGYVDVYRGLTHDPDEAWRTTQRVLSSGIWQFDIQIPLTPLERLPMDLIFDVHSKVIGQDSAYPFTTDRQNLKEHAKKELLKSVDEIIQEYAKEMLRKHVETFTNVQVIPDAITATAADFKKPIFDVTADANDIPVVTFQGETLVKKPVYFNPTNKDFLQIEGAPKFLVTLSNVFRRFMSLYTFRYSPQGTLYRVGIGFDRGRMKTEQSTQGWSGVQFSRPYHALFINPARIPIDDTPERAAASTLHVMMHEAAHINKATHGDGYVWELAEMYGKLDAGKQLSALKDQLEAEFAGSWPTFVAIKGAYNAADTVNVSETLKGNVLEAVGNASSTADAARAIQTGGQPAGGETIRQDPFRNVNYELDSGEGADAVTAAGAITEDQAKKPAIIAQAQQEWKEKQFRSRFFKAWFGDWENEPATASKIMRADGLPLVVYHATTKNAQRMVVPAPGQSTSAFFRFEKGDIGFHFGTVRAAHVRGYGAYLPSSENKNQLGPMELNDINEILAKDPIRFGDRADGLYIIPAVLNVRNPLHVGAETFEMWDEPVSFLNLLTGKGLLKAGEAAPIIATIEALDKTRGFPQSTLRQRFEPVRQMLARKGYDGIVYENLAEGDTSFVAFKANQVKSVLGSRTFSRSDNMHMELDLDAATPEGVGGSNFYKGLKNFTDNPGPIRRMLRRMQHLSYHVLELQQLAHLNPDVSDLSFMTEKNGEYNRYKSALQAKADEVLQRWSDLGKENFARVNKYLQTESEGKELWYDLVKGQPHRYGTYYQYQVNAKTLEKLAEHGINTDTAEGQELAQIALDVKNVLLYQLDEAEIALISVLEKRYSGATMDVLKSAILPVKRQIQDLRKYPFFPQGRFGNLMLTVEEKREGAPGYAVVYREAFESRAEWEKAWTFAEAKKRPDQQVRKHELTDQQYVLMALPTDFVDLAASELGLSEEQVEQMMQILQPVKQEKTLNVYEQNRLGIKGYTSDAMRSFANFTWHNANLLAKLTYRADFNLAIRNVGTKLRAAQYSPDPASIAQVERLGRIKAYMERTRDYIMSPPNELQAVRAVVSIGYLGLNIKTALINFYGLVTTWSDITSRVGQLDGNARFMRAMTQGMYSLKLTDLNDRRAGQYMPLETQQALDRAIEEGVLSQSYAYHLAGMASASNLYRLPARQAAGRIGQKALDLAMWPFRLMELATRRISFLVEFEAAKKDSNLGVEEAYQTAVARTNKLQNDYSLGNRVPFMRGIKTESGNVLVEAAVPLATIFMSFMQHMAFHTYGGYELGERRIAKELGEPPRRILGGYTMKLWLVTMLLAGYEGLPGIENILDLLEIAWRKFGGQKPFRQELRELVQSVNGDPAFWSRGLGHNIAGFDVSRSIGFGRFVPGTDVLAHPRDNIAETVGTLVLDMAGATGGFIKFGLEALFGKKSKAEAFEKLPGGLGNIYTAYRWSQYGVRAPSGALITHDLETGKLRELTADEILGKALGFNPTIVSQNREVRFAQYDRKIYWQTRRQGLLEDVWTAHWQKDREAQADAKKAITEFNSAVPVQYKDLRVTGADIARSVKARERVRRFDEKQVAPQRRYKSLYRDVKGSFEPPESEP